MNTRVSDSVAGQEKQGRDGAPRSGSRGGPQDARHLPLTRGQRLAQDAADAAEVRAYRTHPDVVALRIERVRSQVDGLCWAGIVLGLSFTMTNVQTFAAGHAAVWSLPWLAAWVLDPTVSLVLLAVLRAEQVTSRYQVRTGRWVRAAKWFTLAATYLMNTWQSWAVGSTAGVVLHSVPPLLVFVAAEAVTDLRDKLTDAVTVAVTTDGNARPVRPVVAPPETTAGVPAATDTHSRGSGGAETGMGALSRSRSARRPRGTFAGYRDLARRAWSPGVEITPAWVRQVSGCSRGLSSRLAAALRAELEKAPDYGRARVPMPGRCARERWHDEPVNGPVNGRPADRSVNGGRALEPKVFDADFITDAPTESEADPQVGGWPARARALVDGVARWAWARVVRAWRSGTAARVRSVAAYRARKAPADVVRLVWFVAAGELAVAGQVVELGHLRRPARRRTRRSTGRGHRRPPCRAGGDPRGRESAVGSGRDRAAPCRDHRAGRGRVGGGAVAGRRVHEPDGHVDVAGRCVHGHRRGVDGAEHSGAHSAGVPAGRVGRGDGVRGPRPRPWCRLAHPPGSRRRGLVDGRTDDLPRARSPRHRATQRVLQGRRRAGLHRPGQKGRRRHLRAGQAPVGGHRGHGRRATRQARREPRSGRRWRPGPPRAPKTACWTCGWPTRAPCPAVLGRGHCSTKPDPVAGWMVGWTCSTVSRSDCPNAG